MTLAHRATARRLPEHIAPVEALDDQPAHAVQARLISQIEQALYSILITDESDPADQARKRSQVTRAARAAWTQFQVPQPA